MREHSLGWWLRQLSSGRLVLDRKKITAEERLDGKYALFTSDPDLSASPAAGHRQSGTESGQVRRHGGDDVSVRGSSRGVPAPPRTRATMTCNGRPGTADGLPKAVKTAVIDSSPWLSTLVGITSHGAPNCRASGRVATCTPAGDEQALLDGSVLLDGPPPDEH